MLTEAIRLHAGGALLWVDATTDRGDGKADDVDAELIVALDPLPRTWRSEARRRSERSVRRSTGPRCIRPATARLTATLSMTMRRPTSEAVSGAKWPSAAMTRHCVTVRP